MDRKLYEQASATSRSVLGDPAWQQAFSEGRNMSVEQAVGYALDDKEVPATSSPTLLPESQV
jgi:hypothetical protein